MRERRKFAEMSPIFLLESRLIPATAAMKALVIYIRKQLVE